MKIDAQLMKMEDTINRMMRDCFEHLGVEVDYVAKGYPAIAIRVLKYISDNEYEFGDGRMVGEIAKFEILMADVTTPQAGDEIIYDDVIYQIYGEPLRNLERRSWDVEAIVKS